MSRQYSAYCISDYVDNATSSSINNIVDGISQIRLLNNINKDRDEWIEIDNELIYIQRAIDELREALK